MSEPERPTTQKRWTKSLALFLQLSLGIGLSLAAIVLSLQNVQFEALTGVLGNINGWLVLAALSSVALNNVAKAFRWRTLFGKTGASASILSLLLVHMQGQLWNLVYPMRVGDLSRAWALTLPGVFDRNGADRTISSASPGGDMAYNLGTVVAEKILDTLAYVILVSVALIRVPLPTWINRSGIAASILVVALLALALGGAAVWANRAAGQADRWRFLTEPLKRFIAGLRALRNRQDLPRLFFLTFFVWLTAFFNNYLVLKALDLPIHGWAVLDACLLLMVALQAGLSLPAAPLRIGLFEYICILALGLFGIGESFALGYGLVLHVIVFFPLVVGGLLAAVLSFTGAWREQGAGPAEQGPLHTVPVLGVAVAVATKQQVLDRVLEWAQQAGGRTRYVAYANAHSLNAVSQNATVAKFIGNTDLVYADGISVSWAARFLHRVTIPKMTGRVWIHDLSTLAEERQLRMYLLGGRLGVAAAAASRLQALYPALLIAGYHDGFFSLGEESAILDTIRAVQPHILLVGMGTPAQEAWALRLQNCSTVEGLPNLPVCWIVGALFDYLAGREEEAPAWLDRLGLEWAWRLFRDPSGKWRRYLLGNPRFAWRVLEQKFRK